MSRSPSGYQIDSGYLDGWSQVNRLVRDEGRSFSGRERHCCFLNTKDGRFANVSAVTGLDLIDDGRGVAVVDWDHDGDLDLWVSNRTAPRVRFMENKGSANGRSIRLKLRGRDCNRDAIGARVALQISADAEPILRTVRSRRRLPQSVQQDRSFWCRRCPNHSSDQSGLARWQNQCVQRRPEWRAV